MLQTIFAESNFSTHLFRVFEKRAIIHFGQFGRHRDFGKYVFLKRFAYRNTSRTRIRESREPFPDYYPENGAHYILALTYSSRSHPRCRWRGEAAGGRGKERTVNERAWSTYTTRATQRFGNDRGRDGGGRKRRAEERRAPLRRHPFCGDDRAKSTPPLGGFEFRLRGIRSRAAPARPPGVSGNAGVSLATTGGISASRSYRLPPPRAASTANERVTVAGRSHGNTCAR